MIKLSRSSEVYTSSSFEHGVYTTGSAIYYLNHGFSRFPDHVVCERENPTHNIWVKNSDYMQTTNGYNYGWRCPWDQATPTTVPVQVFRISSVNVNLRVQCFIFG